MLLYELLTGRPPYDLDGVPLLQAARIVQEAPPRAPRSIDADLRGDLEVVLLCALEKEPARRYQSAAALASDLRRFLKHEPIAAHPPSWAYRLTLFARRNRALAAALTIAAFCGMPS